MSQLIQPIVRNIFKVINEEQIDEIMLNHKHNLIVIMYSSHKCPPCKEYKPKFISLSSEHRDVFFIYVDQNDYKTETNKYFYEFDYTPTFLYFFGLQRVAFIVGVDIVNIPKTLLSIKHKINEKKEENEKKARQLEKERELSIRNIISNNDNYSNSNYTNSPTSPTQPIQAIQSNPPIQAIQSNPQNQPEPLLIEKKINLLNKLRELVENGYTLTRKYNLNSDYDEILFEYNFQTNPNFRKVLLSRQSAPIEPSISSIPISNPIIPSTVQKSPSESSFNQNQSHSQSQYTMSSEEQLSSPRVSNISNKSNNSNNSNISQNQLLLNKIKAEDEKKLDLIRQIKELEQLDKTMQIQNLHKLQQLKRVQQLKEFEENREKQNNINQIKSN